MRLPFCPKHLLTLCAALTVFVGCGGTADSGGPSSACGSAAGEGGGGDGSGGAAVGGTGSVPNATGGLATGGAFDPGSGGTGGSSDDCTDSDGDGLSDKAEERFGGPADYDSDGTGDYLDLDSDNDGLPDEVEAGEHEKCEKGVDTDYDGVADFRDEDSDDDGVPDVTELRNGTNPRLTNSDDDFCDDLKEYLFGRCSMDDQVLVANGCGGDIALDAVRIWSGTGHVGLADDVHVALTPSDSPLDNSDSVPEYVGVIDVSPQEKGVVVSGQLEAVGPSAWVMVVVAHGAASQGGFDFWTLSLESESIGTLGATNIVWTQPICPPLW